MIRSAWHIAVTDLRLMLRYWETLIWVILMPILFTLFFGAGLSVVADLNAPDRPLAVFDRDPAGFLSQELKAHLASQGFRLEFENAERIAERGGRYLVIPENFSERVAAGVETPLEFDPGYGNAAAEYDRIQIGRAAYSLLGDLIVAKTRATEQGRLPESIGSEDLTALHDVPRNLTLEVTAAGRRAEIPSGFQQAVPGIMVMFVVISLVSVAGTALLMERRDGIIARLAAAPVTRGSIILGKLGAKWLLGLGQVAVLMIAGSLLFGVDWGDRLFFVALVMSAYAGLLACLGLLVGCLARTEGQTVGIGIAIATTLAALGGCWWPIELAPEWMQQLALFTPTGLTMDALQHLVSFGDTPEHVLPHLLALVLSTVAVGWVAVRSFRYD